MNAILEGDQQLVKTILKGFFLPSGGTNYQSLLLVPLAERIPQLAQRDRRLVTKIIAAQIEYGMKFFNIKDGLSLEQVLIVADEIIDGAGEDNLSIQDVFVFLQKLCTGQMGRVFNRLDVPTFMELFEIHREERWQELKKYKEEQHTQNKIMGATDRTNEVNPIDVAMSNVMGRMQTLKERLKEEND